MPFTFSHPAAVIPIAKMTNYRLPIIALSLGSCSPDFGYYTNEWIYAARSHDFLYSLLYMLPACLLLIAIISLFKKEIIILSPKYVKVMAEQHIPTFSVPKLQTVFLTILAIIIGIYSHIIWDSFTHNPDKFKPWWPYIGQEVHILSIDIKIYKLLQHFSTILGMAVILLFLLKGVIKQKKSQKQNILNIELQNNDKWVIAYWVTLFLVCGLISIVQYGLTFEYLLQEIPHFLFQNAVTGGRYFFIGLLSTLIVIKLFRASTSTFLSQ
ncbi:DUF4184 family protein [Thorsellia kenyensis]|uniref:DUF4184 family protein n=1 Tax=Thorsellia kenyensis TaxID=1549888 RepID=A0ABV6CB64_9GAMM